VVNQDELEQEIAKSYWRKTNYIQPHEYMMAKDNPELFAELKRLIQEGGYEAEFMGKAYRYVNIGKYKYWAYDTLVNRALLGENSF